MPFANSNNNGLRTGMNRAMQLRRQGRRREAVRILEGLASRHSRSAAVMGSLGSVYFELGLLAKAGKAFAQAIELNPKSEMASLGLFHSLWQQGARSEAFAEMSRFLSAAKSEEYTKLLRDLAVAGELAPKLTRAGAA